MTRPLFRGHRLVAGLTAGVALLVLSGCGHQPGAAFQVGSTVVDRSEVDDVANAQCSLIGGQAQAVPRTKLVWAIVNALKLSTIQNGYGDSVGATYDNAALQTQLGQVESQLTKLPTSQRKALLDAITDSLKGDLTMLSVGRKELASRGVSNPGDDEARSAGNQLAGRWADKQGVKIDPRYNLGKSEQAGGGDGSISRPVTTYAKNAASGAGAPGFTGQVPVNQLCG